MAFFDMLGYLIMPPIIDCFGRIRSLTGSYIITSSAIIISSLLTYFDVAGVGMLCRILGQYINHTTCTMSHGSVPCVAALCDIC